ncbi:MAG: hypothetical protein JWN44_2938 [Myxococcales bacterium]|nr:hypothetical protein [Myxococcales bacterium]
MRSTVAGSGALSARRSQRGGDRARRNGGRSSASSTAAQTPMPLRRADREVCRRVGARRQSRAEADFAFRAEPLEDLRTTNLIESTFAVVKLRQRRGQRRWLAGGRPRDDLQSGSKVDRPTRTTAALRRLRPKARSRLWPVVPSAPGAPRVHAMAVAARCERAAAGELERFAWREGEGTVVYIPTLRFVFGVGPEPARRRGELVGALRQAANHLCV